MADLIMIGASIAIAFMVAMWAIGKSEPVEIEYGDDF